jgi:hypothetical protein
MVREARVGGHRYRDGSTHHRCRYERVDAMPSPRRRLLAAFVVSLAALSACATGSSSSPSGTQPGALATFAKAFDGGSGHRRLVLLMSPT